MKGRLVVIIGPSGSGKSELVKALLKRVPNSSRLITVTTRSPRQGEENGRDFHFMDTETFKKKIEGGDFIEYTETHGYYYGSSGEIINASLAQHPYVFAVIDVKGAQALKKHFPDALTVFVNCGTLENIKQRLITSRKEISDDELNKRLKTAEFELGFIHSFDMVLDNFDGEFHQAVEHMAKQLV